MGRMKDIAIQMQELCESCGETDVDICREKCVMSILTTDGNGKLIRVIVRNKQIKEVQHV